jgi:hypothetical protein
MEDTELSSGMTVRAIALLLEKQDREQLADFLLERFRTRYIEPLKSMRKPHGFLIVSVCCFLIESLQAFREGWTDEEHKQSKRPYRAFFKKYPAFGVRGAAQADEIYDNVRCGLLHFGETKGGWRIHRGRHGKGIVDFAAKTIHATRFLAELHASFEAYAEELKRAPWHKLIWRRFCDRLGAIIKRCATETTRAKPEQKS